MKKLVFLFVVILFFIGCDAKESLKLYDNDYFMVVGITQVEVDSVKVNEVTFIHYRKEYVESNDSYYYQGGDIHKLTLVLYTKEQYNIGDRFHFSKLNKEK